MLSVLIQLFEPPNEGPIEAISSEIRHPRFILVPILLESPADDGVDEVFAFTPTRTYKYKIGMA